MKVYDRFELNQFGTIMSYIFNTYVVSKQSEADLMASDNPMAIAVLANLYVNQTRTELEKRAEYKKKLFELAKIKGYDIDKTERLLTFVLYLMQLPEDLEAEVKAYYKKNKKSSAMSAATIQIKPSPRTKKEKLAEDAKFIRDLSYEFAYGKSYEEIYDIVHEEAAKKLTEQAKAMAEQAKAMAAEQAKAMAAEQAKTITTMFRKTGWSADKIADISGFPLGVVQKVLDKL